MTDIYANDKILAALDDSIKELESLKLLMVEGIIMPTDINLSKRAMADREVTMNVTIDIDYEIMEKK